MGILPIILGGALLVIASSSSSKKEKSSTKKAYLSGPIRKGREKCTENEYLKDDNKCYPFWVEGETDLIVEQKVNSLVSSMQDQSFGKLCEDEEINGDIVPNPVAIGIIKQTVLDLWTNVKKEDLPPGKNSPAWLKTVWTRVMNIYYKKACGI